MVHHRLVTRNTLVAALVDCSDGSAKTRARRFLLGLSCDELQFIAEFLGACILESAEDAAHPVADAHGHAKALLRTTSAPAAPPRMAQQEKILVLREFLGRCGRPLPMLSRAS